MSLPTALGKNRFLTSRCLPTIVIIMVSLIQYYFLEMIPTVVSSEILDFLSSPATLTISSVVLLAFLYLFFGDNQRSWKINSAPSLRQARVHFSPVPMVTKSQNLPLERFHD